MSFSQLTFRFKIIFDLTQASREANGLLIMQNGEGLCLEKIKYSIKKIKF